ncbi:hypothetical protein, partial [Cronobacter sakazakii]|uniref:hypothetical protein n=1 Tax=Cronobacter sakazakii TaxID=28141 RepID=UPI001F47B595
DSARKIKVVVWLTLRSCITVIRVSYENDGSHYSENIICVVMRRNKRSAETGRDDSQSGLCRKYRHEATFAKKCTEARSCWQV